MPVPIRVGASAALGSREAGGGHPPRRGRRRLPVAADRPPRAGRPSRQEADACFREGRAGLNREAHDGLIAFLARQVSGPAAGIWPGRGRLRGAKRRAGAVSSPRCREPTPRPSGPPSSDEGESRSLALAPPLPPPPHLMT